MGSSGRRVVVGMRGGLGNQMFQFAAGLALARQTAAVLELDLSYYARYQKRSFALRRFGVVAPAWNGPSPHAEDMGRMRRLLLRLSRRGLWPKPRMQLVQEQGFQWQPLPPDTWREVYLHGYWQSPRYFTSVAEEIRRQFDPSALPELATSDPAFVAARVRCLDERSVSIHVRRGDYQSDPEIRQFHGILEQAWYQQACGLLRSLVPNSHFHVFSDDPAAATAIFAEESDVTVEPMRSQEQDLLLMRSCRHHIIANSSFSWWAAWLDPRADGITIAPRQWFAKEQAPVQNTADLYPPSWKII